MDHEKELQSIVSHLFGKILLHMFWNRKSKTYSAIFGDTEPARLFYESISETEARFIAKLESVIPATDAFG